MKRMLLPAIAAGVLAVAGCGGDDDSGRAGSSYAPPAQSSSAPAAAATSVKMVGTSFEPASLTVKAGDTVTWTNDSDLGHNVVAESGADFESDVFEKGGTYEFTPEEAGTIKYRCTLHPGMEGTITITA